MFEFDLTLFSMTNTWFVGNHKKREQTIRMEQSDSKGYFTEAVNNTDLSEGAAAANKSQSGAVYCHLSILISCT